MSLNYNQLLKISDFATEHFVDDGKLNFKCVHCQCDIEFETVKKTIEGYIAIFGKTDPNWTIQGTSSFNLANLSFLNDVYFHLKVCPGVNNVMKKDILPILKLGANGYVKLIMETEADLIR